MKTTHRVYKVPYYMAHYNSNVFYIRLNSPEKNRFYCFFTLGKSKSDLITGFETLGFEVINNAGTLTFNVGGKLKEEQAKEIWNSFSDRIGKPINTPDFEVTIEGFFPEDIEY